MLLQINSYIVQSDQRAEHARLMRQFRACFRRLGSEIDVYEQDANVPSGTPRNRKASARFVQIMKFRDRAHHASHSQAEREDQKSQELIAAFCKLIDLTYQRDQGTFTSSILTACLPCSDGLANEAADGGSDHASPELEPADNDDAGQPDAVGDIDEDESDNDDLDLDDDADFFDDDPQQFVDRPQEATPQPVNGRGEHHDEDAPVRMGKHG